MAIALDCIHSFLVHPERNKDDQTQLRGTNVPTSGKLFDMLKEVFDKAERECSYEISFNPSEDGDQQNDCRDLIIAYLIKTNLTGAKQLALRLQAVTSGRSGLGLLFLLSGKDGDKSKVVLSRFPADSGILAEESSDSLTVQFLEKVFMKSATAYKAAVYQGESLDGGFWDGKAVDKQINSDVLAISNYWIKDFLASDFRATSAQGTKRLALALLHSTKNTDDVEIKQEIIAAARLASGLSGNMTSISDFCAKFRLSKKSTAVVREQLQNEAVFKERFRLSSDEFSKHISIQSVELSNGAILMAAAGDFDKVFEKKELSGPKKEVRYTTQGQVVDERLKRKRTK